MSFIDDASRFWVVVFLRKKSEAFLASKRFKAWAENATGKLIKMTRDGDAGGEYMSKEFIAFCADHGIA